MGDRRVENYLSWGGWLGVWVFRWLGGWPVKMEIMLNSASAKAGALSLAKTQPQLKLELG